MPADTPAERLKSWAAMVHDFKLDSTTFVVGEAVRMADDVRTVLDELEYLSVQNSILTAMNRTMRAALDAAKETR